MTGENRVEEWGAEAVEAGTSASEAAAKVSEPEAGGELPEQPVETAEVGPSEAEIIAALQAELAEAQAKAEEYREAMQRSAAEFQNSRKRQERQLAEEIERANGALIRRLLPVIDDLELAFQNVPDELRASAADSAGDDPNGDATMAWIAGFRQIQKKLMDVLAEQGVSVIDCTGPFDPMRQEAISSEPSETVESGHVIAALRAGYEYKGRVLRPALVRVAL